MDPESGGRGWASRRRRLFYLGYACRAGLSAAIQELDDGLVQLLVVNGIIEGIIPICFTLQRLLATDPLCEDEAREIGRQ